MLAALVTASASAQRPAPGDSFAVRRASVPAGTLRPVPKPPARPLSPSTAQRAANRSAWNLNWRTSPRLRRSTEASRDSSPPTRSPVSSAAGASGLQPLANHLRPAADTRRGSVRQTAWNREEAASPNAPELTDRTNGAPIGAPSARAETDFFRDPFAEPAPNGSDVEVFDETASDRLPETLHWPSDQGKTLGEPQTTRPRESAGPSLSELIRSHAPSQRIAAAPAAQPPAVEESERQAPAEMLPPPLQMPDESAQTPQPPAGSDRPAEAPESPSDREAERPPAVLNPFDRDQPPQPEAGAGRADAMRQDQGMPFSDELEPTGSGLTCDEFRQQVRERTIRQISLDISPPFRPDIIDQAEYEQAREEFVERQPIRQWRTQEGRELASGRLLDLAYEKAVVETEFGTTEELPLNRLSEADLAYISENWGLPFECVLEQVEFTPRNWDPMTVTWAASNLCHKPLYFQEVNLERYGHTAGPFLQPVISSAHFFTNIAVLPYKMGVHPPTECQYVLGYYRPGNCAPWIIPPVPLSLRGGLTQAAVMTGSFWLIP